MALIPGLGCRAGRLICQRRHIQTSDECFNLAAKRLEDASARSGCQFGETLLCGFFSEAVVSLLNHEICQQVRVVHHPSLLSAD